MVASEFTGAAALQDQVTLGPGNCVGVNPLDAERLLF